MPRHNTLAAAKEGVNIILLQEMFSTEFIFNFHWAEDLFEYAETTEKCKGLARMRSLAKIFFKEKFTPCL